MTGPDPSALLGTWTNADSGTVCLNRVRIAPNGDGLAIRPGATHGSADSAPVLLALGYLGADGTDALQAVTADGHGIRLEGNLNAGLLVLCCYSFARAPGRAGLFSREYFARTAAPLGRDTPGGETGGALFHGIDPPTAPGTGALEGQWRNADSNAGVLAGLEIARDGKHLAIRARPRSGAAWRAARAEIFTDVIYGTVSGAAARARLDAGRATIDIQVRETKGVLVIAHYSRPADDAPPRFDREFFHRA